jgi:hypothetical protein
MNDQRRNVPHLSELSRELARNFLLIHRYDIGVPKRIILYGCPTELMLYIANAMGEEFAGRIEVTITVLSRSVISHVDSDAYCIDVGYFVAHDLSIPPAALREIDLALPSAAEPSAIDPNSRATNVVQNLA